MENQTYTILPNLSSNSDARTAIVTTTTASNSFVLPPSINTITTTPSLQTLQPLPTVQSVDVYSENNHHRSNRIITQPVFSKLLSETIKQEQFEGNSASDKYSITKVKPPTTQSKQNNTPQTSGITSILRNPRETINGLSAISMSMANIGGHLTSTLNASHLPNGTGTFFVSGLPNDLTSNYKIPVSSNSDLPSPSTSSNSSNPPSSHHHQGKRHGEGTDPTRKRQVRLQKNRDAARECRRKKKEYIKCLEERVTGLENQNKALIEELRQLKELYCQRDETNNNNNNNHHHHPNTKSIPSTTR